MNIQQAISTSVHLPMPVTLVGTVVQDKVNFMAAGWCIRVNLQPPMLAISIAKRHYTPIGIIDNKSFSVCLPDSRMKDLVDYCGIVSGSKIDKSTLFSTFYGILPHAPLLVDCPVNLECRLAHTQELPDHFVFMGEIVGAFARPDVLEDGKPVLERMDSMILTMPDNRYWTLDTCIGQAWKDGKALAAP